MRHKALPLPGQLALDLDATEEEPDGVEAGDVIAAGRERTPGGSGVIRVPSSMSGLLDEERDAVS
jgi:hypothetical protein